MSEKKFLDKSGVTYLSAALFKEVADDFATQDYLTAVVEAVDETKLDVNNFITNADIDKICV